ncbi:hypothetical protein ASPVEDRAFT_596033 [Aspergillus versicolor CBS 583.65]|uniref:Uncharacterized protein n=1 Tax=Aspergillus versicolor CBS 583.65 TaxID=1036611 RepID=A0A1L9PHG4_ASPVE|nr:uncharacterized protein ASPVEDRAFT_596033 [Aspergillus versicolor CBS 583.65]OJJ00942.1 hypothetical protein ASPVEDRAFT_596033 [Aspergillus versicolor CBS 583.65]
MRWSASCYKNGCCDEDEKCGRDRYYTATATATTTTIGISSRDGAKFDDQTIFSSGGTVVLSCVYAYLMVLSSATMPRQRPGRAQNSNGLNPRSLPPSEMRADLRRVDSPLAICALILQLNGRPPPRYLSILKETISAGSHNQASRRGKRQTGSSYSVGQCGWELCMLVEFVIQLIGLDRAAGRRSLGVGK